MDTPWFVYMVRCADDSLYTGVATDVARRVEEHNLSPRGARYTRARRPVTLIYSETCESRSHALQREYAIKRLRRSAKLALVEGEEGAGT